MEFEGWDMEDKAKYKKIIPFRMDDDFTYGNMSNGKKDKDKREKIRAEAKKETFALGYKGFNKFAFRIFVTKSKRLFDIENVPKLIVDAFCEKQIEKDDSKFDVNEVGLYPDDTIEKVSHIQVAGL